MVFSKSDIEELYNKAVQFVLPNCEYHAVAQLYRNKSHAYWQRELDKGIMTVYEKDASGHLDIPISGKLDGLFFNTRLVNGSFPRESPFGDYRFAVDVEKLFRDDCSLYFGDFYCSATRSGAHYITLILCNNGSKADCLCNLHLPKLPSNNPFLQKTTDPIAFQVIDKFNLWVEVFYTENVPLDLGSFSMVQIPTNRSSQKGGIPNDKNCAICNIK